MKTFSELRKVKKDDLIKEYLILQQQLEVFRRRITNLKGQVTRAQKSRDVAKRHWRTWRYKAVRERKGKMAPLVVEAAMRHALKENGYKIPRPLPLAFVVKDFLNELERIFVEEIE